VVDNYGCTDSISKPAAIVVADPKAIFYSPDTASCTGRPVSFVNTSTGTGLQYQWDFGDDLHSTDANPIHQYSATGNYIVSLFVTDQYGCKDSASSKKMYIDISVPKARFAVSDSFTSCPPLQVKFSDSSLSYTSLKWDFGDGNRSELENPAHYYTYPGTYFARLIVTGPGGCMDSASKRIDVRGPKGSFSYAPLKGCNPFTVNFNATTLDRISFTWDFSDGTTIATTDSIISHTYTAAGDFVPKMILQDASGCSVPIVGPDTIRVVDVAANFGLDQFKLCDSGRVNLHDSTISNDLITNWLWDFGNGLFATGQHPSFSYSTPGVYHIKLTVTTETGCKDSLLLNDPVTVFQGPRINILGDTAACALSPIDFTGKVISGDSGSLSWQWNLGNGNNFQAEDPPAQTYSSPGPYLISSSATDEHGCKDTVTKSVNIFPIPNTVAQPDTLICVGSSVSLHATGANAYLWNALPGLSCTNCDAPVVTAADNGVYTVTGTNQYGCSSKDSVFVRVQKPLPLQVGPNDSLCLGGSVRLIASGNQVYSWSPSTGLDNPNVAAPRANPSVSTVYTVIARDSANCFSDTGSISITVFPIPTVEAGPDQTIDVGADAQLHGTGSSDIVSWNWSPSLGLGCMDCPDPRAAPKQTTKYTVQVKNEGNCVSTDFLTIYVICNQGNLFIPNAFSPNGDGMNDRFYPRGKGVFLIRSLRVFDRWGEMVFEKLNFNANDASAGWDGTFKGKLLTPDVYVYTCEIVCENNEILSYKGDVTLLR
jgi:gliding motility-associated-like protein